MPPPLPLLPRSSHAGRGSCRGSKPTGLLGGSSRCGLSRRGPRPCCPSSPSPRCHSRPQTDCSLSPAWSRRRTGRFHHCREKTSGMRCAETASPRGHRTLTAALTWPESGQCRCQQTWGQEQTVRARSPSGQWSHGGKDPSLSLASHWRFRLHRKPCPAGGSPSPKPKST